LRKEPRLITKDAEVQLTSQSPQLNWTKAKLKQDLNTKRSLSSRFKNRSSARINKSGKEKLRIKRRSKK